MEFKKKNIMESCVYDSLTFVHPLQF